MAIATSAIAATSIDSIAATVRRRAPSNFRMAMTGRRDSAKAAAALEIPNPPIASALKSDQQQHLPDPVGEAPASARRLAAIRSAPAAIGEAALERLAGSLWIRRRRH